MNNYEKFTKATGDKIRATNKIRTFDDGTEEWRAVVDLGELPAYEKNVNGLTELIRPIIRSNKCYRIYMKDEEIVKITSFRPVFREYKKKNKKDGYAPRNSRGKQQRTKYTPRIK